MFFCIMRTDFLECVAAEFKLNSEFNFSSVRTDKKKNLYILYDF